MRIIRVKEVIQPEAAYCLLLAGFWFINRDEMDPLMTPARRRASKRHLITGTVNSIRRCPMKK